MVCASLFVENNAAHTGKVNKTGKEVEAIREGVYAQLLASLQLALLSPLTRPNLIHFITLFTDSLFYTHKQVNALARITPVKRCLSLSAYSSEEKGCHFRVEEEPQQAAVSAQAGRPPGFTLHTWPCRFSRASATSACSKSFLVRWSG